MSIVKTSEGFKYLSFEGKYDRNVLITPAILSECQGCSKTNVPGLHVDNSGEEYTPGMICFDCIKKLKESI